MALGSHPISLSTSRGEANWRTDDIAVRRADQKKSNQKHLHRETLRVTFYGYLIKVGIIEMASVSKETSARFNIQTFRKTQLPYVDEFKDAYFFNRTDAISSILELVCRCKEGKQDMAKESVGIESSAGIFLRAPSSIRTRVFGLP